MSKKYSYLVLGSGKQGVAAAYDLISYGNASRVVLADYSLADSGKAVERLKKLLRAAILKNRTVIHPVKIDAGKIGDLKKVMMGHDAVMSALPYYFNPVVAQAAISSKVNYCDLGGYFESTQRILKLDAQAKKSGVTLVPDCGVSPGMCNSLAVCAMDQFSKTSSVHIYCGGLPQKECPPLNYKVVFNLEGVLGNYFGKSYLLRNGKIVLADALSEREEIDFGRPLGKLEAAITGGATSTCPWTFKGKIKNFEYKTLRYPGHYDKIIMFKKLGLLETVPVQVNGYKVIPRQFFASVVGPQLRFPEVGDLLVMKIVVRGEKEGKKTEIVYDILEYDDPKTGFTAMQRTTGFSAAIVLEMLAQNLIGAKGVVPVEKAVPGSLFLKEVRKRGIKVKERVGVKG